MSIEFIHWLQQRTFNTMFTPEPTPLHCFISKSIHSQTAHSLSCVDYVVCKHALLSTAEGWKRVDYGADDSLLY